MTNQEPRQLTKTEIKAMTHDEILKHDPDRYIMTKNEAIQDTRNNYIIVKAPKNPNFTDPKKRKDALETRRSKAADAALQGLASISEANTPAAAWMKIAAARATAAANPENPQGNAATRLVGEMTGLMSPQDEANANQPGITVNIDAQTAARLLEAIARRPAPLPDNQELIIDQPPTNL